MEFSRSGKILTKENIEAGEMRDEQIMEMFNSYKIDYEEFSKDPQAVLNDEDVLVSIDDKIYSSKDAVAIIITHVCFK